MARKLVMVAVALAMIGAIAVAAVALDDSSESVQQGAPAGEGETPGGGAAAPLSSGGGASCVELYGLDALTNREVVFDGTVVDVSGDSVTFEVEQWFKGGDQARITLQGAETIGAMTSVGDAVDLSAGSRLLVAGDGGFAWSCGFTQPYDEHVAEDWASALGS